MVTRVIVSLSEADALALLRMFEEEMSERIEELRVLADEEWRTDKGAWDEAAGQEFCGKVLRLLAGHQLLLYGAMWEAMRVPELEEEAQAVEEEVGE